MSALGWERSIKVWTGKLLSFPVLPACLLLLSALRPSFRFYFALMRNSITDSSWQGLVVNKEVIVIQVIVEEACNQCDLENTRVVEIDVT